MKIKNLQSGMAYQLSPDTQLKVERTNPFFNEYGEQTVPVSLPDTASNRLALGLPGWISNSRKPSQMIPVTIQDGEYFMECRQALLGVTPNDEISTSFYMNEGSFYSRLGNVYITEVFAGEIVNGVSTLEQAIAFMKNLDETGGNEMFSVFQCKLDPDDDGKGRYLNGHGHLSSRSTKFDGEEERVEVIDGKTISVSRGFYMSPFLKANYVLQRLFAYFGYTLLDSLFTQDEGFKRMVFVNNVADAIVSGTIHLEQLLPKISCQDILNLFRKKFCCEFIPDEIARTVSVVFFKDLVGGVAGTNLTNALIGKLKVEFPDSYKQLIIEPEFQVEGGVTNSDSLALLHSVYPTALFNKVKGYFSRSGYKVVQLQENMGARLTASTEIVGETYQRYYEGGNLEGFTVKVPECIPGSDMYIGKVQFLNSSMVISETEVEEESEETVDKAAELNMYPMLAYSYKYNSETVTQGTVSNYMDVRTRPSNIQIKFTDYALVYNGPDGIFERFYRPFDSILRNSMHTVKATFLLSQHEKMTVPSYRKIVVGGSEFVINKFNYALGGKNIPVESELYTVQQFQPVSIAKAVDDIFPIVETGYRWVQKEYIKEISESEYNESPFKDADIAPFYPPAPTSADVGKILHTCYTALPYYQGYALFTFWLVAEAVT